MCLFVARCRWLIDRRDELCGNHEQRGHPSGRCGAAAWRASACRMRRVLALVHLVAQRREWLQAGGWWLRRCASRCARAPSAARADSSASGVVRGVVPAWLWRGSVDGEATALETGRNAFRIVRRHFLTGPTLIIPHDHARLAVAVLAAACWHAARTKGSCRKKQRPSNGRSGDSLRPESVVGLDTRCMEAIGLMSDFRTHALT